MILDPQAAPPIHEPMFTSTSTSTAPVPPPPALTAEESKCVEMCISGIVEAFKTIASSDCAEIDGEVFEKTIDTLGGIACQTLRRGIVEGGES